MIRRMLALLLPIVAMLPVSGIAAAQTSASPVSTASVVDRLREPWWAQRHAAILATLARHPDPEVVLIGDSITNNYDKATPPDENFAPTWKRFYASRRALNLGFSGDTTSDVLWRLAHGEVAGIRPRVVLLSIGTNDTGRAGRTAAQTIDGINAIVADLTGRLPDTRILLLGILPSGVASAKSASDAAVNADLARRYAGNARVTYLDIGSVFRRPDATLNTTLFYDPRLPWRGAPLHPDTIGQRLMAEAIEPTLSKLLGDAPRVPLAAMTDVDTAIIPVPWLERDSYDWYDRHRAVMALGDRTPRIVLIGDSITHFWAGLPAAARVSGQSAWNRVFAGVSVANLGFGWDRTQNVLWRLRAGEIDGMTPDWVVLNIGTNNLTGTGNARANTPAEVVAGVSAIIDAVHARTPHSRIALMAIFPRGATPADPLRRSIDATNRLLAARFGRVDGIRYIDIGRAFLTSTGDLDYRLLPDGTHPNAAGYQVWADALRRSGIGRRN